MKVFPITPEQRQQKASENLDRFFESVPEDLRREVASLPARISGMSASVQVKLNEVLRTADRIFGHAGQYAACARGCGHCCHVHVPIADFEARYIADRIGVAPVPLKRSIQHDRMKYSGATPCPFLREGECSIYEARPLTCRMHLNFDVDNFWCLHENWHHPEATIPRPTINSIIEAYYLLPGKTAPVVADIRDFFPNGKAI